MGPMLIFDKSALQAISLDESVWLEQFFLTNITPLFYVEVLADLEKEVKEGKSPEIVVGELAKKTPIAGTFSNIHHHTLLTGDLLGNSVEMKRRPFVRGGQPRITPEGKIGFYFEESIEDKALLRWSKHEFLEIEKEAAKNWRQALSELTFDTYIGMVKNTVPKDTHFSNLEDIRNFVDHFLEQNDPHILDLALIMLDVPQKFHAHILARWKKEKPISLRAFAPYATYIMSVDMFFYLALNSSFISKERPSNKIDISYLYYLPFCMIFVSRDKLHKRVAPLFLQEAQIFVDGDDMKAGLKELDVYFTKHKEEINEKGVMSFASLPQDKDTYIGRLHKAFRAKGNNSTPETKSRRPFPREDRKLVKLLKEQKEHSKPINIPGITSDEADHVTFTRMMPVQKGKWRILPKGIEDKITH